MKLSENTKDILSNFISFNSGIVIREGNILSTTTLAHNVAIIATVAETFPKDCAIHNLRKLMALVSLFDNPDLEFDEKVLIVKDKRKIANITYCPKECVRHLVDQEFAHVEPIETFILTKEDLVGALKALAILGNPEIKISGANGKLWFDAVNSKVPTADVFSTVVEETDKTFSVILRAENMKMIPMDYNVEVSETQVLFISQDKNLKYYLATEA
jgi:hypothetical protein